MIIDCHGHYTTEPKDLHRFRQEQTKAVKDKTAMPSRAALKMSDDEIRESLEGAQLKLQRERGTDLTIFSPRASGMGHHIGDESVSLEWSQICNDLIARVVTLYPEQLHRRVPAAAVGRRAAEELDRRAGALREDWASSAATSIPIRRAAISTRRRSPTSGGIRSTRRWSSSTCRR